MTVQNNEPLTKELLQMGQDVETSTV